MERKSLFSNVVSHCDTCHGTGVLPGSCREDEWLPCPTCKGKGVIEHKVSTKRVEERPCDNPSCHGGRVQLVQVVDGREVVTEKMCPVCEGYGIIYREYEEITTEHEVCPSCEGRAVLTAGEMRRRKIEDFCPVCHGTGVQVEDKSAKGIVKFGLVAFFYPAVAIVSMAFKFMIKSVKTAVLTKAPKDKEKEQ